MRTGQRTAPVVVVGNGPVGQTTALLLARWGVPSILLDSRERRDVVGSKAICQQRDVLDVWDSVGAGRAIADEGVTWTTARTFFRGDQLFSVEFADPGHSAFPPWVNISQCRTEEVLDERIVQESLIQPRWSHEVTGLRDAGEHVEVDVDTPDGPTTLDAAYVVGCAGAHGDAVREGLGIELAGRSFEDQFLICDIKADLPGWERERRFYFDPEWNPGRQVLIHPCPDSTYRIDWQVPAEFDLAAEEDSGALDTRIRQVIGDRDYEIVWRSVYRFHTRCVDRMRAGRVLLAGDCAHLYAPFGARGLNSGVGDAENAAWKLAFVLHGWAGPDLLDSYDQERRAAARENLAVTTETMDFLVPQTEEAWARRSELLEQAVDDPGVHPRIDSGRLAEPYWYCDSALTTADPSREPATRPPRGQLPRPGVGVLLPDFPAPGARGGEPVRLRELARVGILLLTVDHDGQTSALVQIVREITAAPVRGYSMRALTGDDSLVQALAARPGEVWLIRPDAFVAAVLPAADQAGVAAAVRRLLAESRPR